MPLILGKGRQDDAEYLDACRKKRNIAEYDLAGATTQQDAAELITFAKQLRGDVLLWLGKHHPGLLPRER